MLVCVRGMLVGVGAFGGMLLGVGRFWWVLWWWIGDVRGCEGDVEWVGVGVVIIQILFYKHVKYIFNQNIFR